MMDSLEWLSNKSVLVTGCCGTIGSELIKQISQVHNVVVIGVDINENLIFSMTEMYKGLSDLHFFVCDIRDLSAMERHIHGVDVIFHTAALKHVVLGEASPDQVVKTNLVGLENMIYLAKKYPVEKFIFTSSDKAVGPTNVMGASKLMGERLVAAEHRPNKNNTTKFIVTRFGNVLGSEGSVYDIFKSQIIAGKAVTITDERMTRYLMTIGEAVSLVIEAGKIGQGGEIIVTKMPIVKICDLALAIRDIVRPGSKLDFTYIGIKPGEKLFEELMTVDEAEYALHNDQFFLVPPRGEENNDELYPLFRRLDSGSEFWKGSNNGNAMEMNKIRELIVEADLDGSKSS